MLRVALASHATRTDSLLKRSSMLRRRSSKKKTKTLIKSKAKKVNLRRAKDLSGADLCWLKTYTQAQKVTRELK